MFIKNTKVQTLKRKRKVSNYIQRKLKFVANATYIHGWIYISHSKPSITRLVWQIFLSFMIGLTLYACLNSITVYNKFNIDTSISYDIEREIRFPAITFCSSFQLLKSKLGSNEVVMLSVAEFQALTWEKGMKAFQMTKALCKSNVPTEISNYTMENLFSSKFLSIMAKVTQNSLSSVKMCWWKNRQLECDGMFGNHFLDSGACFTLTVNPNINRNILRTSLKNTTYGWNASRFIDSRISTAGQQNGWRFLLNSNNDDHCDVINRYAGTGFFAFFHDVENFKPITSTVPTVNLAPGYKITLMLKPTIFTRKTAHLGKCRPTVYFYDNSAATYFKDLCLYRCMFINILKNCNCLPVFVQGAEDYFTSLFGIDLSTFTICKSIDQFICGKNEEFEALVLATPTDYCPECIDGCFETKYEILVTYEKFPPINQLAFYRKLFNVTYGMNRFRKNYLLLEILFPSMTVSNVVEYQAFSLKNLFVYMGNVTLLFVGMSFMSFTAIGTAVLGCFFDAFKEVCDKIKVGPRMWKRNNPAKVLESKTPVMTVNCTKLDIVVVEHKRKSK